MAGLVLLSAAAALGATVLRPWHRPATVPDPSVAAGAEPVEGATGIGDPYFPGAGNAGYDVGDYAIELRYDPATDRLDGRTTITGVTLVSLRSFSLDLRLPATAVEVDGRQASFTQDAGELRVTPAAPLVAGAPLRVVVSYAGVPSAIPQPVGPIRPWTRTPDGAVAVGEPDSAAWWFPSNDHPSDKAAVAVTASVPAGVEVISNGALLGGPEPLPDGREQWRWRAEEPMAGYLAFVAIGQYDLVRRDTAYGPYLAAYPVASAGGATAAARAVLERTPQILDVLVTMFGRYPFGQLGGVVVPAGGFALETQTRPVYPTGFLQGPGGSDVVVHELAHQWFGDSVSLARWRDIWLNEGFATYAEWLYSERTGGPSARALARQAYAEAPAGDSLWTVAPGDPGPSDLFDEAVYVRGAMAVHALRETMGDADFFAVLRAWLTERAGRTGSVEDFLALAEQVSGEQLDDVARDWLYDRDRPSARPG